MQPFNLKVLNEVTDIGCRTLSVYEAQKEHLSRASLRDQ